MGSTLEIWDRSMRPAPTWFGVRRHIIDGSFGGAGPWTEWGLWDIPGLCLRTGGCVVWDCGSRSEFVGFILCLLYRRHLKRFLPRLLPVTSICRILFALLFSLNLYGGGFFFFASSWELNVGNGKVETTRRVRFGGLYPACSDHPPFLGFLSEVESQKIVGWSAQSKHAGKMFLETSGNLVVVIFFFSSAILSDWHVSPPKPWRNESGQLFIFVLDSGDNIRFHHETLSAKIEKKYTWLIVAQWNFFCRQAIGYHSGSSPSYNVSGFCWHICALHPDIQKYEFRH